MKKKTSVKNFDINSLKVAKPCHVGWESMSGDEKIRHCNACQLNVYNISEMTKNEVTSLIKNSNERLCGKIYKRNDGTVITKDCPIGLRDYRKKISRLAGATFTAILSLFSVGFGQSDSEAEIKKTTEITRKDSQSEKSTLFGEITDKAGALIPNAEIELSRKNKNFTLKTRTSDNGNFKLSGLSEGIYSITVRNDYFKTYKIEHLVVKKNENIELNINLEAKDIVVGIILDAYDDKKTINTKNHISNEIELKPSLIRTSSLNRKSHIKGIIRDSVGAVIPAAKVELKSKNKSGKKYKVKSSDKGKFSFESVPPGNYQLKIKYSGFETYKIDNLFVKKNENIDLNVTLHPKESTVTIGIFVDEPLLNRTDGSLTNTISGENMRKLPIRN